MKAPNLDEILNQDDWLRRMARAIVHDPVLADDLTQDAWVVALQRGRSDRTSRSWLLGVLHHSARSVFRGEAARRSRQGRSETAVQADGTTAESTVDVAIELDLRRRVVEVLMALDEPYRTALHQRYILGESLPELARKTGVSTSTADARCTRGLAKLRYALGQQDDAQDGPAEGSSSWPTGEEDRARRLEALVILAGPSRGAWIGAKAVLPAAAAVALGLASWAGWAALSRVERVDSISLARISERAAPASVNLAPEMAPPLEPPSGAPVGTRSELKLAGASASAEAIREAAPAASPHWLTGRVLLASGIPTARARLQLLRLKDGAPVPSENSSSWRADEAGEFRWAVPASALGQTRLLVARQGGKRPYSAEILLGPETLAERHELVLEEGFTVEGRVVRGGEPISDLYVNVDIAWLTPGIHAAGRQCWWRNGRIEEKSAEATTDANGVFRFTGLCEAEHRLQFQEPNAPSSRLPLHVFQITPPDTRTYDLQDATLLVSVFDSSGRLAGATVRASEVNEWGSREWLSGPEPFAVEVPAKKTIRIEAQHPAAETVVREVEAPGPGQQLSVDLSTKRIERPRLLVRVSPSDIGPLESLPLRLATPSGRHLLEVEAVPLNQAPHGDRAVDGNGDRAAFLIEAVPLDPGPYLVSLEPGPRGSATSFRYPDARLIELPAAGDVEIEFRHIQGGRCKIEVLSDSEEPWKASYSLIDAEKRVCQTGEASDEDFEEVEEQWEFVDIDFEAFEVTDTSNTFTDDSAGETTFELLDPAKLEREYAAARARASGVLRPGRYVLKVTSNEHAPVSQPVVIDAGKVAIIEVALTATK